MNQKANIESSAKLELLILTLKRGRWLRDLARYIESKEKFMLAQGFRTDEQQARDFEFLKNLKIFWNEENDEYRQIEKLIADTSSETRASRVSW